jgi:hypothetical protein
MRNGKLLSSCPRSVLDSARWNVEHAPDGLDESEIDALIEQAYAEVADVPVRPGWMATDVTETRAARRKARQVVRTLPATEFAPTNQLTGSVANQGKTAALRAILLGSFTAAEDEVA